jgi:hypothetical protein
VKHRPSAAAAHMKEQKEHAGGARVVASYLERQAIDVGERTVVVLSF